MPLRHLPTDTTTAWQQCVLTTDVDAHAQAQRGFALHYEQLSPGRFSGLVHHVQLPHTRLVHERCDVAVRQRGVLGQGHFGFAMPLVASAQPAHFNGQRVAHDDVMLGSGAELDLTTPPGFSLIGVVIAAELLNPLWQQMYGRPPSAWIHSQVVVPTRPGLAAALRERHLRTLQLAAALLAPHPGDAAGQTAGGDTTGEDNGQTNAGTTADTTAACQLRDALLIEWFEALPDSIDASAVPSAVARRKLVDRACALMLAHPDEPLSMLSLCRQVGTSRRRLDLCFHDVLGLSPARYLRTVRLNGLRRALRAGAPSVQDAAACWGFWHLGQLAHDYQRQFGELPSKTRVRG